MKFDFSGKLFDLNGDEIKREGADGKAHDWHMGNVAAAAVLNPSPNMTASQMVGNYDLAQRLNKGGEVELSAEDIVVIKDALPKTFAPIVAAPILKMLA